MIQSVSLWRFNLPFSREVATRKGRLRERHGLLLNWQTADSEHVWSEVSPLPAFSLESLEACEHQLKLFFSHQIEAIKHDPGSLADAVNALYPSVQFGLETGLLLTQSTLPKEFTRLKSALTSNINNPLDICALIDDDKTTEIPDNSPVAKVKVGRLTVGEDIERISRILETAGTTKLRLDANQSWSLKQAQHFFSNIDCDRIEYIEEPLALHADYSNWNQGVSFAWDETLREDNFNVEPLKGLTALVVKPMLSGLRTSLRWSETAEKLGLKLVISSAYETSLSLNFLYRLACALPDPQPPGLDTHQVFEFDMLEPIHFPCRHQQRSVFPSDQLSWLATYS